MNVQDHGTVEKHIDPAPRLKIQIATSTSITLGNKDFGAWDILTDSLYEYERQGPTPRAFFGQNCYQLDIF